MSSAICIVKYQVSKSSENRILLMEKKNYEREHIFPTNRAKMIHISIRIRIKGLVFG